MLLPPDTELDLDTAAGFTIRLEPRGKGRPRASRGTVHTDEKTAKWKTDFLKLALGAKMAFRRQIAAMHSPKAPPLRVELELYFRKPKRAEWFCTSPVDNDNAEKNVWDALQGTFFPNDNRIVSNETFKAWADDEPYLKIRIVALKKKGSP